METYTGLKNISLLSSAMSSAQGKSSSVSPHKKIKPQLFYPILHSKLSRTTSINDNTMFLLLLLFCQWQAIWRDSIRTSNFKYVQLWHIELIYHLLDWMLLQSLRKKCLNGPQKCGNVQWVSTKKDKMYLHNSWTTCLVFLLWWNPITINSNWLPTLSTWIK